MEKNSEISAELRKKLLKAQENEITEYHVYKKLVHHLASHDKNRKILLDIAADEKRHYDYWKGFTGVDVKPRRHTIRKFYWIAKILGLTFGAKLMERGESQAQVVYNDIAGEVSGARQISEEEDQHEKQLLEMIHERSLDHADSIVLGLNDALVELTGALAGLTLALQNTRLIAIAALITGVAASLSMAASEYLSKKTEGADHVISSSVHTGIAYIITVALLVAPYFIFTNYYVALGATLIMAIFIILAFTYYIAIAKNLSFRKRFTEMAALSLSVAAISFGIGYLIRHFLGVDI